MKYITIILVLLFFIVPGCLDSSPYKEVSSSELSIFTERDAYHSNETLKVHLNFNSTVEGMGQIQISGIKNEFDRALINETREDHIKKGPNGIDFEFTIPSCEECSALKPGIYSLNATVKLGSKTFETYKNITLERETK